MDELENILWMNYNSTSTKLKRRVGKKLSLLKIKSYLPIRCKFPTSTTPVMVSGEEVGAKIVGCWLLFYGHVSMDVSDGWLVGCWISMWHARSVEATARQTAELLLYGWPTYIAHHISTFNCHPQQNHVAVFISGIFESAKSEFNIHVPLLCWIMSVVCRYQVDAYQLPKWRVV